MNDVFWFFERSKCRCETCNKQRMITRRYNHWFDTMDGGDYLSYQQCWLCELRDHILKFRHRLHNLKPLSFASRKLYRKIKRRKKYTKSELAEIKLMLREY